MAEFPNNDTKFKKGQSGNPKGYPKGQPNTSTILKRLFYFEMEQMNPFTKELEKMSVKELMNLVQIKKALEGDLPAYKELLDREEGKVTDKIDHSTLGEKINIINLGLGNAPDEIT